MIGPDEAEDAVHELINTADKLANLEGRMRSLERAAEICLDLAFISSEGKNIEEKKARARLNPEYSAAYDSVTPVLVAMKTLHYSRKGWADLIDLFRTQESTRRQGL